MRASLELCSVRYKQPSAGAGTRRADILVSEQPARGALPALVLFRVLLVLLWLKGELLLPLVELAQRILLDVALGTVGRTQALPPGRYPRTSPSCEHTITCVWPSHR